VEKDIPEGKFKLDQLVYCIGDGDTLYRVWKLSNTAAYLITTEDGGCDAGWESLTGLMTVKEYEDFYS